MPEIELTTFNRCDDIVLRIPDACIVAVTARYVLLTEGREIVVTNQVDIGPEAPEAQMTR